MGLDQYLTASKYVGGWEHGRDEEREQFRHLIELTGITPAPDSPSLTIKVTVAYWRKANQIHQWFVNNVQDGTDDCGEYYVSREQLTELRDLCQRILDKSRLVEGEVNDGWTMSTDDSGEVVKQELVKEGSVIENPEIAQELLPTTSGFFFGCTDYDEYYYEDLQNTVTQINDALANTPGDCEFYYQSSW